MDEEQYSSTRKSTKRIIVEYSVSFGALLLLTVIIGLLRYFFFYAKQSSFTWLIYFADILSISGMFGILFWGLLLVSKGGAFDILIYGTKRFIFSLIKKDPLSGLPRTYADYVEQKRLKRGEDRFYYLLFVSALYFVIGIILLIVNYGIK